MLAVTRVARRGSMVVGLLLVARPVVATAQRGLGSERQDLNNARGDIWSVWTSPARVDRHEAVVAAGVVGTIALTTRVDSIVYAWMTTHDGSMAMRLLSPVRERAKFPAYELGSGQYLIPAAGLVYAAGRLSHSAGLRDAGMGCVVGQITSIGIREVALHLVSRARPRVTPHPFQIAFPGTTNWLHESFYSGHMANTMTCASFLSHRFHWGASAAVPYGYATAVGVGRLADGAHWTSDMLTGAIMGFAIGKALADRELGRSVSSSSPKSAAMSRSIPILRYSVVF